MVACRQIEVGKESLATRDRVFSKRLPRGCQASLLVLGWFFVCSGGFLPKLYNRPSPDGMSIDGELGLRWEADVLGGAIEHYAEPLPKDSDHHPPRDRQARDLWLINELQNRLVQRDAIWMILAFGA